MAKKNYVLKINKDKDFLRQRCDEVSMGYLQQPAVKKLVNDIKDTLLASKDLVALSASQLGKNERVFCIKFANGKVKEFINPVITKTSGSHLSRETSIGLDSTEYIVPRADEIIATYQTTEMIDTCDMNKFSGAVAEVFQQMNDMLNGVLLEDIGLEIIDGWDEASAEEREEIIKMYLESLEKRKALVEKQIEENPDSKDMNKAIEFMKQLEAGKIETMPFTEEELKQIAEKEKELDKEHE